MTFRAFFWPVLASILLCLSLQAHALTEDVFPAGARAVLEPFVKSGQAGTIEGKKGITLGYRKWEVEGEKAAIVFVPGRGDNYRVFAETIHDLVTAGYSVYSMDERGQGTSERLLKDPQISYVDKFEHYVDDLNKFLKVIVNAKPHAKRILMSHSMGGGISARYLLEHEGDFDSAVLVAPMLKVNTKPYDYDQAQFIIAPALMAAGRGKHYAPNRGPFDPNEKFTDENELTTSAKRFGSYHKTFVENPVLQVGGAAVKWVSEVFENSRKLHWKAEKIKTPMLIVTAGRDVIVDVEEQAWFCSHVSNCTQFTLPEAKHNVYIEQDKHRDPAIAQILEFLAR